MAVSFIVGKTGVPVKATYLPQVTNKNYYRKTQRKPFTYHKSLTKTFTQIHRGSHLPAKST